MAPRLTIDSVLFSCKEIILKNSKDFNGNNSDDEVMKICGISRGSYYKYKRELKLNI